MIEFLKTLKAVFVCLADEFDSNFEKLCEKKKDFYEIYLNVTFDQTRQKNKKKPFLILSFVFISYDEMPHIYTI